MMTLRAVLISAVILLGQLVLAPSMALEPLPSPSGPVILTIDGAIDVSNTEDGKAAFDLAMLEALPRSSFTTTTIWTDGPQTFEGASITDLMARLGSKAGEINAIATNDYEIRFPVSDARDHAGLIAYRANGALLPPGNKGPLWIVFPFDSDPLLQTERFQSESIWSLATMTLR
jgi:hypothetical protein